MTIDVIIYFLTPWSNELNKGGENIQHVIKSIAIFVYFNVVSITHFGDLLCCLPSLYNMIIYFMISWSNELNKGGEKLQHEFIEIACSSTC